MNQTSSVVTRNKSSIVGTNRVIRNTYLLLSCTLFTGALTAWYAMVSQAQPIGIFAIIIYFGLFFATTKLRNSGWGILCIFLLTSFLGYTLGPLLNHYMHAYANGSQLISMALGATAVIFLGLSFYAFSSRKDFSYLGGFITVAIMIAFLGSIAAMVFNLPILSLIVSGAFALISAGFILFMTSRLINGGETNYIMATLTLYVSIFNLFVSLLQILGAFGGRR